VINDYIFHIQYTEKNIPYMFSIAKTAWDVFHIAKKIYDIGNEQTTIMRVKNDGPTYSTHRSTIRNMERYIGGF